MFDELKLGWRLWTLYSEVKDMDKKALLKVLVAALMAAAATAGASYLETDSVNFAAVGTSVVAAVLAYLKQSPLVK